MPYSQKVLAEKWIRNARDFSPDSPERFWGPPSLLLNVYGDSLSGGNSHPSSADVKNEWSYATTPPSRVYVLRRVEI
jgi:hypothetical protein